MTPRARVTCTAVSEPRTYAALADLPLRIERYSLDLLRRESPSFTRCTTVIGLQGDGHEGLGEDVCWTGELHEHACELGPVLELTGDWTIDSFSRRIAELELFDGVDPGWPVYRNYRRWAYESAALDLALRQAGVPLHEVLGREPRPVRFVVSTGLGDPPSAAVVLDRIEAYGEVRYKLDANPSWGDDLLAALAGSGAVDVIDFKGAYKGTAVDVETDPDLYRRVALALPDALLEDPDLTVPAADAALEPFRDRITWDAVIHSIDDAVGLAFAPKVLNVKPSRFGSLAAVLDFIDYCGVQGISLYGGGQSELGVGRGQIQLLASLFYPDAPNDVAPAGWDRDDWPATGLPVTPLDPAPDDTGFRRR